MSEHVGGRYVVTGGSSGIGLEIASRLVAAGGEVCLVARRAEPLATAARRLGAAAWPQVCDVADPVAVEALTAAVCARWDALDGVVNNAGVAPMGRLDQTDTATWDHAFAVNVRGPFLLLRGLAAALKASGRGAVVNVSSNLAEKAIPGMAAYNASKAALNQLTRSLALEWAPAVRVNGVMPGVVDTPIHASRGLTDQQVQGMGAIHPLGRVGTPADVAAMVVFLLSDATAWVTGVVVPVDGGVMAG